jgi:hypothetical protein
MPVSVARAESDGLNQYLDDLEIELITVGAGPYYWSAFGHSAIRIRQQQQDYTYGFGYFDFEDDDFFIKFAKGETQYFLGIQEAATELNEYQQEGRAIWTQELDLSTAQKLKLIKKLDFLSLAENRYYHYDYFLNNCTSRIKDILDEVTDGEISRQQKGVQTSLSWNDLTFPARNQTWMNLGIAMGYGIPAYINRDQWQLSVFPERFSDDLQNIKTQTQWNKPKVNYYQPAVDEARFNQYSFVKTHYAMLLSVLIISLGMLFKFSRKTSVYFWLILQSLLGVALLMLWFLTKHTVTAYNINVLLFVPYGFLLLKKSWRQSHLLLVFKGSNLLWLLLAIFFTNLYLLGFLLLNLYTWYFLKSNKA